MLVAVGSTVDWKSSEWSLCRSHCCSRPLAVSYWNVWSVVVFTAWYKL